jgi:uncharacterized protein YcaQ
MKLTVGDLREHAITHSLFRPSGLRQVFERLGFVQADPIRAPARAQDLILRHRARDYRVGDLEARYLELGLEEDYLYAYGFVPQSTWRLLHPRRQRALTGGEKRVLEIVTKHERIHPRELEAFLGRKRKINAWGGYSKATTTSLHRLHYLGFLRVAGREKGIRLYAPTPAARHEAFGPAERLRRLVLIIATILAPLSERSLRATVQFLAHAAPHVEKRRAAIKALLDSGELAGAEVDGIRYVWPTHSRIETEVEKKVRFLAPFDPLVWDRRRFEHLWGWAYRFEAYTPPSKRKMGYYAMPMLWRSRVVGWVNISQAGGEPEVRPGFVKKQNDSAFRAAFEEEVGRFRQFLKPRAILKARDTARQAPLPA